jgi:hypothetical protein|tara:strand:+ start:232 stop:492 length:261 start_codon:yes stop_codon:yes gene_type:complete
MAKCIHKYEPSDQCPYCRKEMHDLQFGGIYSGEVGLSYKGKSTTKLGLKEAREERAEDYDPEVQKEVMSEFVQKSFTTELNEEDDE